MKTLILQQEFQEIENQAEKQNYTVFLEELKFREYKIKDLNSKLLVQLKRDQEEEGGSEK